MAISRSVFYPLRHPFTNPHSSDRNLLRGCSKDRRGTSGLHLSDSSLLCIHTEFLGALCIKLLRRLLVSQEHQRLHGPNGRSNGNWQSRSINLGQSLSRRNTFNVKGASFFHSHRSRVVILGVYIHHSFNSSTPVASSQWPILAPILTSLSSLLSMPNSPISIQSTLSLAR